MFLTLPGDITTLQLYLLYSAVNSLQLRMDIVCRTALSEWRICSHKSSLRWSINSVNGNDLQQNLRQVHFHRIVIKMQKKLNWSCLECPWVLRTCTSSHLKSVALTVLELLC